VSGRLLLLVGALAAAAGCLEDDTPFPLVITAVTDDGAPVPDLTVTVAGVTGKSGPDGKLRLQVAGKEGARIPVSVTTPAGYRLAAPADAIVLRRLTEIDGNGRRPLPVEHTLRFAPLTRRYAILVRTGVAGLPVEIFGAQKSVTNDKGVAAFLYDGTPGDELQVKLVTAERPELRPQSPSQSFLLAPRSEAYLVKEHFTVVPLKKEHKHKPVHVGPTRL
jgi:hypothetical protein